MEISTIFTGREETDGLLMVLLSRQLLPLNLQFRLRPHELFGRLIKLHRQGNSLNKVLLSRPAFIYCDNSN